MLFIVFIKQRSYFFPTSETCSLNLKGQKKINSDRGKKQNKVLDLVTVEPQVSKSADSALSPAPRATRLGARATQEVPHVRLWLALRRSQGLH